ncbi:MAG: NAD(P)H-dependent glycerol-3-phosphate dehydrogenase [Candidatus Eiseniibacteriota bacterium]
MKGGATGRVAAVLGAGSWGTTLAMLLQGLDWHVRLWDGDGPNLERIRAEGENRKYLPGIALPETLEVVLDLPSALEDAALVTWAVPSVALREVARAAKPVLPAKAIEACATKGLEPVHDGRLPRRMSEVLHEELGDRPRALLVGPSHAEEVSRGVPTSVVAAALRLEWAEQVQQAFFSPRFRVYTQDDLVGVEMGSALKNVIALAAGVGDGLGYGDNTKGALLTRGLAEMSRLGTALGARRDTFFGLSGMGDLITTAISRHSRNRRVGERLGRREAMGTVLEDLGQVAEGVTTAPAARALAEAHGIEAPITREVCALLYEGKSPQEALFDLLAREAKREA